MFRKRKDLFIDYMLSRSVMKVIIMCLRKHPILQSQSYQVSIVVLRDTSISLDCSWLINRPLYINTVQLEHMCYQPFMSNSVILKMLYDVTLNCIPCTKMLDALSSGKLSYWAIVKMHTQLVLGWPSYQDIWMNLLKCLEGYLHLHEWQW